LYRKPNVSGRCTIGFKKVGPRRNVIQDWVEQTQCHFDSGNERSGSAFTIALEFVLIRHTIERKDSFLTDLTGCQPSDRDPVIPTSLNTSQEVNGLHGHVRYKKLSWHWQTRATRSEVSQGYQT